VQFLVDFTDANPHQKTLMPKKLLKLVKMFIEEKNKVQKLDHKEVIEEKIKQMCYDMMISILDNQKKEMETK
jgi:hypothetical protein